MKPPSFSPLPHERQEDSPSAAHKPSQPPHKIASRTFNKKQEYLRMLSPLASPCRGDAQRSRRRTLSIAACRSLLAPILLIIIAIGIARAQTLRLQLEVMPTSVDLSPQSHAADSAQGTSLPTGKRSHVWLIVRNPTEETLNDLRLSWIDLEGVDIEQEQTTPKPPKTLLPSQEVVFTLLVSQVGEEAVSGVIPLRVDYLMKDNSHVASASLTVKSREYEAAEKILDVQVKTTLESLKE